MLDLVGRGTAHTCAGLTRRDFLQVGTLGAVGFGLPQYAEVQAQGALRKGHEGRACILIFNLGGLSHLDTLDMKPQAPAQIRGPFQPIATRAPDIQVSEILPRHATVADKFSLVRSCYHTGPPVHEAGWQLLQTGRLADPGMPAPHVGAVAASLSQPARRRTPHVILPAPVRPSGGTPPADLSAVSPDPTCLGCNPSFDPVATNHRPPTHQPLRHIGAVPLPPRQRLRDTIEAHLQQFEADRQPDLGDDHFQIAYRLLASRPVREAMALSGEAPPVRQRYGRSRFGQSCLLARRLIEAGVRFVTVNTFLSVHDQLSWDVHGRHAFPTLKDMQNQVAPMYDQAYTALIEDLADRGLLEQTLVCNLTEFGRTPRINTAGGRDHWPQCFTVAFAGGGVQGGRVVGRSDPHGAFPAERPVEPGDILATIFHSLGCDPTTHLPGPDGQPRPLVDSGRQPIRELF